MGLSAFEKPPTKRRDVHVMSTDFQFTGQMEVLGNIVNFLNDARRDSISLYDAHLTPLTPGSPMKGLSRDHVVVRRPSLVFVYFDDKEVRDDIQPLIGKALLVAYTPVAVCRGYFHMSAEANVRDFLDVSQGDMLVVTEAMVFPLVEFPAPFPEKADKLFICRKQILSYHPG